MEREKPGDLRIQGHRTAPQKVNEVLPNMVNRSLIRFGASWSIVDAATVQRPFASRGASGHDLPRQLNDR
jgi:hypothetical protein